MDSKSNTNNKNYSLFRLVLVIPFYNEEKRISADGFIAFALQNKDILAILINDGSCDNTGPVLNTINSASPGNIEILTLEKNNGKGNAIRAGIQKAIAHGIPYVGYMDADLSVSFDEMLSLNNQLPGSGYAAVFGSRIKRLGSTIKRSFFRHFVGRVIATIIDSRFNIGCYDTQCSAKVFTTDSLHKVINEPFYTRWFFDVELILRIQKETGVLKILEVPLTAWEHKSGSKINVLSVFAVIKEIFILFSKY